MYKHDDRESKETDVRCQRDCSDINRAEAKKQAKSNQKLPDQGNSF